METVGEMIDRIQSVCRLRRKVKPVVYLDLETRSLMYPHQQAVLDFMCAAYKVDDGPVHMMPWEVALARKDWAEADRLRVEMFAEIRRQHRLDYYEDFAWIDKSWLTRKFLTFAAWTRTIFKRWQ